MRLSSKFGQELEAVPDVGPIVAGHIRHFFKSDRNLEVVQALVEAGVNWPVIERQEQGETLAGKTFVLTGTLTSMNRADAKLSCRRSARKLRDRYQPRRAMWSLVRKPVLSLLKLSNSELPCETKSGCSLFYPAVRCPTAKKAKRKGESSECGLIACGLIAVSGTGTKRVWATAHLVTGR